jgi:hydroxymethylpyrimidine pyrophosphatase-like HAD family hydrolase
MTKVKMICFDMDGTIANLYGVQGWLEMVENENPKPYEIAKPMWNMVELNEILRELQKQDIEIRIITWLAKDSTENYKEKTRQAKLQWLANQGFPFNNFHGVAYGTTKANAIRKYLELGEQAILIDDNAQIRQGWNVGDTIDPTTENIIDILKALL